jgi:hypothetical protein
LYVGYNSYLRMRCFVAESQCCLNSFLSVMNFKSEGVGLHSEFMVVAVCSEWPQEGHEGVALGNVSMK